MRKLFALVIALVLLSACTTKADTAIDNPDTTTPGPTAADGDGTEGDESPSFNDPSAGPDRAPNEPRIVPPLLLPTTAPGTDAAAAALLDELDRFLTDDQRAAGVPWPALRNADPIAVYKSSATFQAWMSVNNPTPSLVEAYTAPDSPERDFDLELFGYFNSLDLRSGPGDPPYSMRIDDLVHPASTGITDALLELVPEGSAAVIYWDSVGSTDQFTADGQYWSTAEGWVNEGPWIAIMAPTDVGWQVWYDELIEPPPPGSRQQQGPPLDDATRQDL